MNPIIGTIHFFLKPEIQDYRAYKYLDDKGMYVSLKLKMSYARKMKINGKRVPKTDYYLIKDIVEPIQIKVYGLIGTKTYTIPIPEQYMTLHIPRVSDIATKPEIIKSLGTSVLSKNTFYLKNYRHLNVSKRDASIGNVSLKVNEGSFSIKKLGTIMNDKIEELKNTIANKTISNYE